MNAEHLGPKSELRAKIGYREISDEVRKETTGDSQVAWWIESHTQKWEVLSSDLSSCVTVDKSLNPHCLAPTVLLLWNKYTVSILRWKLRV